MSERPPKHLKPMKESSAIEWLDEMEEVFDTEGINSITFTANSIDRCQGDNALFITRISTQKVIDEWVAWAKAKFDELGIPYDKTPSAEEIKK